MQTVQHFHETDLNVRSSPPIIVELAFGIEQVHPSAFFPTDHNQTSTHTIDKRYEQISEGIEGQASYLCESGERRPPECEVSRSQSSSPVHMRKLVPDQERTRGICLSIGEFFHDRGGIGSFPGHMPFVAMKIRSKANRMICRQRFKASCNAI